MGKNGQALIEFVMILPILIILLLGIVDLSNMFIKKYEMISYMDDIVAVKNNNVLVNEILTDNDLTLKINPALSHQEYVLTKVEPLFTPGLNLIFEDGLNIKVVRNVYGS